MKHRSIKFNNFEFDFTRVNVILGANGAGKSSFLNEIKSQIGPVTTGGKAVFIEGGRTIKIMDVLQLDHRNVQHYDRLESALVAYEGKRSLSLADRVFDALVVLEKKGLLLKANHSDKVDTWLTQGRVGDPPVRSVPPMDKLFELFNEIFPQITLTFSGGDRRLSVEKNGRTYGPSLLSDGEKQVFSILADLIELQDEHQIIIADEPELNLHPELAERLWTLLENEFPEKIFIYATHSINFALRENVETIYVLSNDSEKITKIDNIAELPRAELAAFLGGLPGVLSTNKVIVTEGHEKSFDSIFYRWLLNDPKIEIFPGGPCTDVFDIVTKKGLWDKISTKIALAGVIDSDFRSLSYLDTMKTNLTLLPLHEAESFLCLPEVLSAIADRIGSQEKPITESQITEIIFRKLETEKLIIAAKRVFCSSKIQLAVSLERKTLANIETKDHLVEQIKEAADGEIQKAIESLGVDNMQHQLETEIKIIEDAVNSRDHVTALRLLPGKELLNTLAPRAGCKNANDLMRSLRKNFKPEEFVMIKDLKDQLIDSIAY